MPLVAVFALSACSDEGDVDRTTDASMDFSGDSDGGVTHPDAAVDAPVGVDATPGPDARAPSPDAEMFDAAAPGLNVVFASFNGMLLRVDPATGAGVEVGLLRNAANETETYANTTMTWSGVGNTAFMVLNFANPVWGTADLCTGLVTRGMMLTRAASPSLVVEGIAVHPNGTVYVSAGQSIPNSPISSHVGTLNLSTAVITNLGMAAITIQNDVDLLFFKGTTLYGMDVATNNNRLDIFTVDLGTGAITNTAMPTYASNQVPLRLAYDASRDKTFSWRASDRNLLEIALVGNTVTPIGPTHTAGMYNNQLIRAFFVAPPPVCPL